MRRRRWAVLGRSQSMEAFVHSTVRHPQGHVLPSFLRVAVPWLLLLALPAMVGFGPPHLVESDREQLPIYGGQLPEIAEATPPPLRGVAALIMDAATGRVIYERNGYHHVAPASTTKLMTALVALDHAKLTDRITVRHQDIVEGSSMGLLPGEQPTVEDLLWGLLLPSGNDAAQTLAGGLGGGSVDRFVGWMNDKARELGLRDTHFRNPHGLDEDGHYSSAYDLTVMARHVLEHPLLAQIVSSTGHNRKIGNRVFFLVNTNRLLGRGGIPGADGVKTGFTENAGDSLIGSATRDGHRVIVAALGTNFERAPVAAALVEYAFSAYTWVPLGTPVFARWQDDGGTEFRTLAGVQRTAMVLRWQVPYLGAIPEMLPSAAGAAQYGGAVGRLTYRTGPEPLIDLPLFLQDGARSVKAERGS